MNQFLTPFFSKLKEYADNNKIISFDVPGHHLGRLVNEFSLYVGSNTMHFDANAPYGLDSLAKPHGVLKEAQELFAEAFKAEHCYFITGGSTMGILSMIMSQVVAKEKIFIPRNVHKSVISALIISGAVPIFLKPNIDLDLGIANNVSYDEVVKNITKNPTVKYLFLINPTYYGATADLKRIIDYAHSKNVMVILDEAHGSHLYFAKNLPVSGIEAGADMTVLSMHKTGGSMTQSSVILTKSELVDKIALRSTINMLQSTSPNSLLLASLDVARKHLYFNGETEISKALEYANYARSEINKIDNLFSPDREYFINRNCFDYDETKVIIKVSDLKITGFEFYRQMRSLCNIQLELSEPTVVLAIFSIGNTLDDAKSLVEACKLLSNKFSNSNENILVSLYKYQFSKLIMRPREAYHANHEYIPITSAINRISAETVMLYPPGIPILIPGELITESIVNNLLACINSDSYIYKNKSNGDIKVVVKEKKNEKS